MVTLKDIAEQAGVLTLGHFGSSAGSPEAFPMPVLELPKMEMAGTAVRVLLDLLAGKPAPDGLEPIPGRLHVPAPGLDSERKGTENA